MQSYQPDISTEKSHRSKRASATGICHCLPTLPLLFKVLTLVSYYADAFMSTLSKAGAKVSREAGQGRIENGNGFLLRDRFDWYLEGV